MPVTWFVLPERPEAELLLIDPYIFSEFEDAMLSVLETSAVPQDFRILIDRRTAARPTSIFIACMVNFFRAYEARLVGTRAAVLVSKSVPEALPDLRVGRFRIRTFQDAADAARWLHPDGGELSDSQHAFVAASPPPVRRT
jgi:hypothetical protein